tara:strand:+ start:456 stop:608 length:153 start_codon:yes stop_codon:yes gene_type:complete
MIYKHPKTGKPMKFVSQIDFYNFMFGEEFMNSPVKGTIQEYNYMKSKINK